jgi:hypothetical protein
LLVSPLKITAGGLAFEMGKAGLEILKHVNGLYWFQAEFHVGRRVGGFHFGDVALSGACGGMDRRISGCSPGRPIASCST